MAKNAEKTAATKSRETKLSKKSVEELIAIILRKDETERNLSNQIKNLKSEINTLAGINKTLEKDKEDAEQSISIYQEKLKNLNNSIETIQTNAENDRNSLIVSIQGYIKDAAFWRKLFFTCGILWVILSLLIFLV